MGNVCDRNFSPHPRTLLIFINIFVRCALSSLFDIFHILISTKIKGKKNSMSQVFFIVLLSFLYDRHVSSNRFRWQQQKYLLSSSSVHLHRRLSYTLRRCSKLLLCAWCETRTLNPVGDDVRLKRDEATWRSSMDWQTLALGSREVRILRRSTIGA